MKYYERRAVKALQDFEEEKGISGKAGGASPWYISFTWYIRLMLLIAVVAFFLLGLLHSSIPESWWKLVAIILSACRGRKYLRQSATGLREDTRIELLLNGFGSFVLTGGCFSLRLFKQYHNATDHR
jgi:hypothetical protein